MIHKLTNLIKDAGYAATAGQGFPWNVTGAGAGTHMTDYNLTDWTWATSDYSSSTTYAYNAVIHFAFSFVAGDHFFNIYRPFSEIVPFVDVPADPGSYGSVSVADGGYNYNPWGIAGQHGLALQIRGANTNRTIASWTGTFGYTDGADEFTDPSFPVEMYADFSPTYNSATATNHTFPITITYPPTNYNDGLSHTIGNVTVAGTVGFNSFDIEWYSDAGLTTLVATATTRVAIPDVSNTGTNFGQFWIRYREENGLWSTSNLHWWDRRSYGSDPN